jgi:molybdopterin-guanine dinucleotide biosynthesis protein A
MGILTGILLAGGKSSRMGTDKGMMLFRGKKLACYPLDILGKYCQELLISTDNDEYSQFGYPLIYDEIKGIGPMGGISSALRKSSGEWNLVFGCDLPFLNEILVDQLIQNKGESLGVVPVHQGWPEPLAALYHRSLTALLDEAIHEGNYSLHSVLRHYHVTFLPVDGLLLEYPLLFRNFNTRGDITPGDTLNNPGI